MLTLTDEDFHRLYTYIKKNYGIDLGKKRQLIVSRLSNMLTANGYTSFKPYVDEIISGQNRDMVTSMLNKLTTNYTYFMREEAHFNYLRDTVLPNLARAHERDRVLSIWSAGCSSGEEPYTISMYLKEGLMLGYPRTGHRHIPADTEHGPESHLPGGKPGPCAGILETEVFCQNRRRLLLHCACHQTERHIQDL